MCSREILNADVGPPWRRMDINELQPIKPTRDSLLQDQQTSQLCYKIAIPEGETTCSLLYTKCFSLGSLVFYIKVGEYFVQLLSFYLSFPNKEERVARQSPRAPVREAPADLWMMCLLWR